MEAGIKLYASSFSMVSLPVLFPFGPLGVSWSLTPTFSRRDSCVYFIVGLCKRHCLTRKSAKCEWVRDRIVRAAECVTNEMPVPGEKLNIVLMCIAPLMVPISRCAEHTNFVRPSPVFENFSFSAVPFTVEGIYMFYSVGCSLRPAILYFWPHGHPEKE